MEQDLKDVGGRSLILLCVLIDNEDPAGRAVPISRRLSL